MNKSTRIILLIVSAVLIVGGIVSAVLSFVLDKPAAEKGNSPSVQASGSSSAEPFDTNGDDITVEYTYDNNGYVTNEKYYKSGKFYGQLYYYYGNGEDHTILLDAEGNEIGSTKTQYNIVGSISFVETYENHTLVKTVEYDYYEDLRTPKKKTEKVFSGNDELAEKTYFGENGKKTQVVKFENGTMTDQYFYDADGNITKNGGDSGEIK